ncbi:MAG: SH3 domain-containing protein [Oligoflexales bacterium]
MQISQSIRKSLLLSTKALFLFAFGLSGCSLFKESPIARDPFDRRNENIEKEEVKQAPSAQDQWKEEEELPQGPASSATEALNEVMSHNIDMISEDFLEGNIEYWVSARQLNVRSGPSARYEKVGSLRKGTKVIVLERRGNWIRIESKQWVSKNFLKERP